MRSSDSNGLEPLSSEEPTVRFGARVERFPHAFGKYLVSEPIGSGGMATVHLAIDATRGDRVVAVKRLLPHLARDEQFTRMLLDEAAIAACVLHPNVTRTYGAEVVDGNVLLFMSYVPGLSLGSLIQRIHPGAIPPRCAAAIMSGILRGLHAAHEAVDWHGRSLEIVHRDVSPQNIMIGADGVSRLLDFGIAKAARRLQTTGVGELKGKLAYMSPEQLLAEPVDRRTDVRAAGVVLWEALTGRPLFHTDSEGETIGRILSGPCPRPSSVAAAVPPGLDAIVLRALAKRPADRFGTALEMAVALEALYAMAPACPHEIGRWVQVLAADSLREHVRMHEQLQLAAARRMAKRRAPSSLASRVGMVVLGAMTVLGSGWMATSLARDATRGVAAFE